MLGCLGIYVVLATRDCHIPPLHKTHLLATPACHERRQPLLFDRACTALTRSPTACTGASQRSTRGVDDARLQLWLASPGLCCSQCLGRALAIAAETTACDGRRDTYRQLLVRGAQPLLLRSISRTCPTSVYAVDERRQLDSTLR